MCNNILFTCFNEARKQNLASENLFKCTKHSPREFQASKCVGLSFTALEKTFIHSSLTGCVTLHVLPSKK